MLARLAGQSPAQRVLAGFVAAPVHAYLFQGAAGTGKRAAAVAFAAALECPAGGCGTCASCAAVLAGAHPDVVIVERTGASISVDTARDVGALAQRTPRAGAFQVVILCDFHLVDRAAPALLKTIEEPPDSTVFIVLAESVPSSLETIASRCVTVEFRPLEATVLESVLLDEGVDPELAAEAAAGASGRLDRARLLAADPGFSARRAWWDAAPGRLDGTGAAVETLVAEVMAGLSELLVVVRERQEEELAGLRATAERTGERRVPGLSLVDERHRREQRRVRTDELRAGLAILAIAYARRLSVPALAAPRRVGLIRAAGAIDEAAHALSRNPNEELLLEALFVCLDGAG